MTADDARAASHDAQEREWAKREGYEHKRTADDAPVDAPDEVGDRSAHHVSDPVALNRGLEDGEPVTADCGKVWVPARNPDAYPLCQSCADLTFRRGWIA